ncbi:hypothetical protein E4U42_004313 [Claviceps africana]|uniref:CID domain-containing protein n=1 Tax=Claviceps africana TaxID=83212 RepID=A0A8K0NG90_9HYPO|nr:hypothetical protein E4U42_004313 [Claviceps africana]
MAYNDDSVLARLSSLNESHESIATAAQWIMFHRRHADRTVQLWMQRLKDSSSTKRLSLMYLANEVVQQSRIRHKEDFVIAFSPVVAEATSLSYKGAPADIQAKLRRVVDVWKDRSIFEAPIQKAVEARLDELDKARGAPKSGFGGSPFGSTSIPSDLTHLVNSHQEVVKQSAPLTSTIASAIEEYDKQLDPGNTVPSAPVYAARLNGLLKILANAENAVAECVKARENLVSSLEKLLNSSRTSLASDKKAIINLRERKQSIEKKKQEVEMAIMRALGPAEKDTVPRECGPEIPIPEPGRPEVEALTPPPMSKGQEVAPLEILHEIEAAPSVEAGSDMNQEPAPDLQSLPISVKGSNKRRRIDDGDDFSDLIGNDNIDPEVAKLLGNDETI